MDLKYLLLFCLLGIAVWGIFYDRSHTEVAHPNPASTEVTELASKQTQPSSPSAASSLATSDLVKQCSSSLLIVEGDEGRGSASVINVKGNPLIVTNIHVVSGNTHTIFRLLDGREVIPETLGVPEDRDIMVAAQKQVTKGLEMSTAVDRDVSIGDQVLVLGNSQGANVATVITGKILGLGPDLIETDAKFVEGNSGSPIIHVKTGKVIGIATFAIIRKLTKLTRDSQFNQVRRYGYRIDTVPAWRFLTPDAFSVESNQVAEIQQRTSELLMLAKELIKDNRDTPTFYKRGGWVRHYVDLIGGGMPGTPGSRVGWDRYRPSVDEFYRTMNADLDQLAFDKLIPYHRKELSDERETRSTLEDFFKSVDWETVRFY